MKESNSIFNSNNNAGLPRARARYLTQALALEEESPSSIIRASIFLSIVLFVSLVYWASITQMAEVSIAPGEILPAGLIHNIQHLEGGIIASINVRNGDVMKKGDPLISLSPQSTVADLQKVKSREFYLNLQIERLNAIINNRNPSFVNAYPDEPSKLLLISQQQALFDSEIIAQRNAIRTINQQIVSKEGELVRNTNQINSLNKEVALLNEQVNIRKKLSAQGLLARTELLTTQSNLLESLRTLRNLEDSSASAASAIQEKRQLRAEVISAFIRDKKLESGDLLNQLSEVKLDILKLQDRLKRLNMTSPINGIIQALSVSNINAIVSSSEVIMRIVPIDDELIVEARLSPSDIGYIRIGQTVEVKVDSFDSSRFGSAEGIVDIISATTYLDEQQAPYYKAKIKIKRSYLGDDSSTYILIPGMTVQAHIKIGVKTLLDYLLKPISRGFDNAFHEV